MRLLQLAALLVALAAPAFAADVIVVTIETAIGSIDVEIDSSQAPATAANFLEYVDARMYPIPSRRSPRQPGAQGRDDPSG